MAEAACVTPPIDTDALVIGAGPVGLFQVFQLGLLGIGAHLVDALPHAGGQCVELYGDKPIYDIPGIVRCTGRELIERLQAQIAPFNTPLHLGQEVAALQQRGDGRFDLETSTGQRFIARTIFIAAGVGAFVARQLKVEGIDRFRGEQLFYRASDAPAAALAGRRVVLNGGDDHALQQALLLAESIAAAGPDAPSSVTLVHRRDGFQADQALVARMRAAVSAGTMDFVVGQITGFGVGTGMADLASPVISSVVSPVVSSALSSVIVAQPDGSPRSLPADTVLALLGVAPRLGPIANWALAMERRQLVVDPQSYATEVPGIFAVGDINTYPGKRKLIACGFHECILAAYAAAEALSPGERVLLQYTTTSTVLQQRLGVAPLR